MPSPTGTLPVNEIARTPGCSTSGVPTAEPRPITTFRTPAGSPASSSARTMCSPVSGESCASFNTIVLP